jgi:preprotein translocase subunit SecE
MVERIRLYINESYDELRNKVTWPTWTELQESAVIVLVATLIIALIIYLMDTISHLVLNGFYGIFK